MLSHAETNTTSDSAESAQSEAKRPAPRSRIALARRTSEPTIWRDVHVAFEACVICGAATQVPVTAQVCDREDFVSGVGQLCPDCAATG